MVYLKSTGLELWFEKKMRFEMLTCGKRTWLLEGHLFSGFFISV